MFDNKIVGMISNKKIHSTLTELFIRGQKTNISLVFILQSHFPVPKDVSLNTIQLFIMKIPNRRELQKIAMNHYSDVEFSDFMVLYKKCTARIN